MRSGTPWRRGGLSARSKRVSVLRYSMLWKRRCDVVTVPLGYVLAPRAACSEKSSTPPPSCDTMQAGDFDPPAPALLREAA